MIVVDASVLVVALADDDADGDLARARLRDEQLTAPDLINLEVLSVLRRLRLAGKLPRRRADIAAADLARLPLTRVTTRALLPRCWELHNNFTPYDAAYLALAEALDVPLITADKKLAAAPGLPCAVEVFG